VTNDPVERQPPSASLSLGPVVPDCQNRSSAAPAALAFALGAVALWATNALVGKTLLALYPVSQVQFLQFCGAALVFALIRLFPSPLVGSEGRGETRGSPPCGGSARQRRDG
jgi:drug/metabolite transporter (DMT)-like permease